MINSNTDILKWLINHAKATEWVDNPVGGQYCDYCANYLDLSKGQIQIEHNENCQYVQMMKKAEELLKADEKTSNRSDVK